MPFLASSTYHSPVHLGGHFQTIYPSYFATAPQVDYTREKLPLDDGDYLYLDWAKCPSPTDELLVLCHGLCGHTRRHYCLSMVHAFREIGVDCLAWNYRGTGQVDNQTLHITSNNSTGDLHQVITAAISRGYRRIYLAGFSMGANLIFLYLGREWAQVPPEVRAAVGVCGPIDSVASIQASHHALFGVYEKHFVRKLKQRAEAMARNFPGLDLPAIMKARSFQEFDQAFTAPILGFPTAQDYYRTSSAFPHLEKIRVPALLINPVNDPLLTPNCFPVQKARENPCFYLEIPQDGGHCGFLTPKGREWWPAERARQFVQSVARAPEKTAAS
ncbi:MAG: YheT family hydrolase [Oligosphaeraceae bacterium]